jgi:hypothetical protein
MPKIGQFVQVRFHNGIFFDATVKEWSDGKSILILSDQNEVIIHNTLQNVLLVKIIKTKNVSEETKSEPIKEKLVDELEKEKKQHNAVRSDIKMAELKDELNRLEREEQLQNIKTFKPDGFREVNYGIPRHISIGSASQHTDQKTTSTDSSLNSELQNLFNQKY